MKRILMAVLTLTVIAALTANQDPGIEKELMRIHQLQREAWNEGDIEGFMAHYWQSPEMTFQSGDTRLSGWEALMARYKKAYPEGNMGKLEFSDLIVHVLSEDSAYVLGKWKLEAETWTKEGLFTTVWKKVGGRWKIIHDHTS